MWRGRTLTVVTSVPDTDDVLAAGIMDELWNLHLTPDNAEKLIGSFVGGIFFAGMFFSMIHRVRRRRSHSGSSALVFERLDAADASYGDEKE